MIRSPIMTHLQRWSEFRTTRYHKICSWRRRRDTSFRKIWRTINRWRNVYAEAMSLDFEGHHTIGSQWSLTSEDAESVGRHGTTRKDKNRETEFYQKTFRNDVKKRKLTPIQQMEDDTMDTNDDSIRLLIMQYVSVREWNKRGSVNWSNLENVKSRVVKSATRSYF